MYYSVKISEELHQKIVNLFKNTMVGNLFDNNIPMFIRSAVRMQIVAYYTRDKVDMRLESIYSETSDKGLKIQKAISNEIRTLFENDDRIKKKYNNSINRFINYAIVYHLVYWLDVIDQIEDRSD